MDRAAIVALSAAVVTLSCAGGETTESRSQPVIHGADDRRDYYQVDDAALEGVMQQSVVALIPNAYLRGSALADEVVPSYGEAETLCEGQPFAEQPAAAFCSGVLVDYDLVLTAGHCVRALSLADFSVVFDYYYAEVDRLALGSSSIYPGREVPTFRRDPSGQRPRLDFGFVRLARPVDDTRRPLAVHTQLPRLDAGQPLLAIGAGGGLPLKLDRGSLLSDSRAAAADYFTATSDTSRGSSGAPALDDALTLVGILSRGGSDFVSEQACNVEAVLPDGAPVEEQYTYAHRAVQQLCAESTSSLCRSDCESPCEARRAATASDSGCRMVEARHGRGPALPFIPCAFGLVSWVLTLRRVQRRSCRRLPRD